MTAAHANFEAGSPEAASDLLAAAELGPLDELQRARLARLRAQIVFARQRGRDAVPLLVDAAERLERLGDGQAREAYLEALGAAIFAGRLQWRRADCGTWPRPPRPRRRGRSRRGWSIVLLDGLVTRFTEGYVAGAPSLRRALQAFRQDAGRNENDIMRWFWLAVLVAGDMWDDETWHELTTRAVQLAREAGALRILPLALMYRVALHVHAGEFTAASDLIEESDAITEAAGNAPLRYPSLMLAAWRGEAPAGPTPFHADVLDALSWGEGRAVGLCEYFRAVLYNGLGPLPGRPGERTTGVRVRGSGGVRFRPRRARRGGRPRWCHRGGRGGPATTRGTNQRQRHGLGRRRLGPVGRPARATAGPRTRCTARPSRASNAAASPSISPAPIWCTASGCVARTGASTRAKQLRTAYEMLHRFGAEAFAERARRELLATGESVRQRTVEARDGSHGAGGPDRPTRRRGKDELPRSAPSCSSATARSNGTCTRCSPSSTSTRVTSSAQRWPVPDRRSRVSGYCVDRAYASSF